MVVEMRVLYTSLGIVKQHCIKWCISYICNSMWLLDTTTKKHVHSYSCEYQLLTRMKY